MIQWFRHKISDICSSILISSNSIIFSGKKPDGNADISMQYI